MCIRDSASGVQRLAAGTSGQVLVTKGAAADPEWASATGITWDYRNANFTAVSGGAYICNYFNFFKVFCFFLILIFLTDLEMLFRIVQSSSTLYGLLFFSIIFFLPYIGNSSTFELQDINKNMRK